MTQLYVGSEIGELKRVILHRPERALNHLTPSNYKDLLFDDVLSVEQAGGEHDQFVQTLTQQGVEVLLLHHLLAETLEINDAKNWLLQTQINEYRLGYQFAKEVRNYLHSLSNHELSHVMLGGLSYGDFVHASSTMMPAMHAATNFIIEPLPNHLFTRDTSCWIYGGVSLNPMAMPARKRETNHLRAIYRWHPLFAEEKFFTYLGEKPYDYDNTMIEGGDILVIGQGAVLIGMSERTNAQGVEALARQLFHHQQATQVIAIELPKQRSCMHLDTVITHMDTDTFSVYPDVMRTDLPCWQLTPKGADRIHFKTVPNYLDAIANALSLDQLQIIKTGGNHFEAEREQWNDANNVLTIRPGVVIAYEGNRHTNDKYVQAGIEVLTISGDQLGRGRGGPRCMSCPIERR